MSIMHMTFFRTVLSAAYRYTDGNRNVDVNQTAQAIDIPKHPVTFWNYLFL